jgi:hypothetical protein
VLVSFSQFVLLVSHIQSSAGIIVGVPDGVGVKVGVILGVGVFVDV